MPRPKPKSGYKTKRKYGCPYCDIKLPRGELVSHVQEEHETMIPENYTAARVVYDHINGKNYGTCMICGAKVYEWNEKIWRYKNLCNNPKCREALIEKSKNNHLDDPEKQKEMLNNRSISGVYTFRDGGKKTYVGSYEKKTLECIDRVLNIPSADIETPGPTIEYEYNGEKHFWISDIFYLPAMLVIDVKDGGNNPNTRPMESYREKQIAKEDAIIKEGKYNYLRLTDNNFAQLLSAIADIRYGNVIDDPNKGIYIHENVLSETLGNCMIGTINGKDFIIPAVRYGTCTEDDNTIDTYIYGNTAIEHGVTIDENCNIVVGTVEKLLEDFTRKKGKIGDQKYRKIVFNTKTSNMAKLAKKLQKEREEKKEKNKKKMDMECANILYGENVFLTYSDIFHLPLAEEYEDPEKKVLIETFTTFGQMRQFNLLYETYVRPIGKHMHIMVDDEGFYVSSENKEYMIASPYYESDDDIPSDIVNMMDDMFEANMKRKGDING